MYNNIQASDLTDDIQKEIAKDVEFLASLRQAYIDNAEEDQRFAEEFAADLLIESDYDCTEELTN